MQSRHYKRRIAKKSVAAYTLLELLTTITLIAMLSAMLFPVLAKLREKSRQSVCLSNLRQTGVAISLYAADYDDLYPYGADPSDKYTRIWGVDPTQDTILKAMPLLPNLLHSYTKEQKIWQCPSDTGLAAVEWSLSETGPRNKGVAPSLYEVFGSSYFYRTELAFAQKLHGATVYDPDPPYNDRGTASLVVMNDASGRWHGSGKDIDEQRMNALFGDGHVKSQSFVDNTHSWSLLLEKP